MNSYVNNNNTIVLNTNTLTLQDFAIALQSITNVSGQTIFEKPDTLKELNHFYNIKYKGLHPKHSDPITQKDNFTTKLPITFWDSMIFKILVFCLPILAPLSTIPIIGLFIKHKKLKTLVTSIALYKMPPNNRKQKYGMPGPLDFIFGNIYHNNRYIILHLVSL